MRDLVEGDGEDQQASLHDARVVRVDSERDDPGVDQSQSEDAEQPAQDRALTTGKRDTAEQDAGDDDELEADAVRRVGRVEAAGGDDAGEPVRRPP